LAIVVIASGGGATFEELLNLISIGGCLQQNDFYATKLANKRETGGVNFYSQPSV
jgi:hypothetical protein